MKFFQIFLKLINVFFYILTFLMFVDFFETFLLFKSCKPSSAFFRKLICEIFVQNRLTNGLSIFELLYLT
jgi:hypothetical protein